MITDDAFDWLNFTCDEEFSWWIERLDQAERDEFPYIWDFHAHAGQRAPAGDWRNWVILAGRGFGKTRAGAEWVRAVAEADPEARIALVGASLHEVRSVMVEGPSGVLAVSPPDRRPVFETTLRRVTWPNGAQASLFSAAEAESLRGPQHSHAWCDELGKWHDNDGQARRSWDNLMLGMRVGAQPRTLVTTTPRAVPLLQRLLGAEDSGETVVTRGRTQDNAANLPPRFIAAIEAEFGGTTLGRQEVDGEMIADVEGALWSRPALEACRAMPGGRDYSRIVVGVDPPAGSRGDACGIVVVAVDADGVGWVLADASVEKATPEQWARAVAGAAEAWGADRVVAECNQGGAMVESVLLAAERNLPVRLVHASRGKVARAEPVAALYEAGRVRHAALFPRLEDELCGLLPGGDYVGPGRSPDRADALVWALTELMLGKRGEPRVLVA